MTSFHCATCLDQTCLSASGPDSKRECPRHIRTRARRSRPGFTLTEVALALAVLLGTAALVAETAVWSLSQRGRTAARLDAVDVATNILERARALPWDELTEQWGSDQQMPSTFAARWPDCRLSVRVEPQSKRPHAKRVTVEVRPLEPNRAGWQPVTMTAVFAARTTEAKP
jgi:prepilin-type N-terminal cleavage/methylation domain-containing protein